MWAHVSPDALEDANKLSKCTPELELQTVPVCGPSNWHSKPPRGLVGSNTTAIGAEHPRLDLSPRQVCTVWPSRLNEGLETRDSGRIVAQPFIATPARPPVRRAQWPVKPTAVPLQKAGACVRLCARARACSGCGKSGSRGRATPELRENTALAGTRKTKAVLHGYYAGTKKRIPVAPAI
jgi:hypothetical protein